MSKLKKIIEGIFKLKKKKKNRPQKNIFIFTVITFFSEKKVLCCKYKNKLYK